MLAMIIPKIWPVWAPLALVCCCSSSAAAFGDEWRPVRRKEREREREKEAPTELLTGRNLILNAF